MAGPGLSDVFVFIYINALLEVKLGGIVGLCFVMWLGRGWLKLVDLYHRDSNISLYFFKEEKQL